SRARRPARAACLLLTLRPTTIAERSMRCRRGDRATNAATRPEDENGFGSSPKVCFGSRQLGSGSASAGSTRGAAARAAQTTVENTRASEGNEMKMRQWRIRVVTVGVLVG